MCLNAGMLDCPASDLSGNRMKKTNDVGTGLVLDQTDAVRHLLVQYRTKVMDAGMLMPALVSLMLMPGYANMYLITRFTETFSIVF
jgi:hypothetical protein